MYTLSDIKFDETVYNAGDIEITHTKTLYRVRFKEEPTIDLIAHLLDDEVTYIQLDTKFEPLSNYIYFWEKDIISPERNNFVRTSFKDVVQKFIGALEEDQYIDPDVSPEEPYSSPEYDELRAISEAATALANNINLYLENKFNRE